MIYEERPIIGGTPNEMSPTKIRSGLKILTNLFRIFALERQASQREALWL